MKPSGLDIVVGNTSHVRNDISHGLTTPHTPERPFLKDRRKNKRDRRRSVREGIFVSLSGLNERRLFRDRRKNNT
ncbi:MAG: hypothetical protein JRF37_06835 [Deltaproteobacteria bacterium]|nr:hypothetical protein [Deltaproteobacteria bacterium]OEU45799.1 MAG: hypothetical protein BBJ60_09340 [Desulfobacterales bacterium S7086C20]